MIVSTEIPFGSYSGAVDRDAIGNGHCNVKMGFPIVLLHGWGCDSRIWDSLIPVLTQYADIITLDILYHYKHVDECCEAIIEHLPDTYILCGWSLGGMLATRLAGMYPLQVKALITLAANLSFVANNDWPDAMAADEFSGFSESFSHRPGKTLSRFSLLQIKGDNNAKAQLTYLKERVVNNDSLIVGLRYLSVINNVDIVSDDVVCPALLIFGKEDALVPVSTAHKIKNIIKKNQDVVILPNKGHVLLYLDDVNNLVKPEEKALVSEIALFLERLQATFHKNIVEA